MMGGIIGCRSFKGFTRVGYYSSIKSQPKSGDFDTGG